MVAAVFEISGILMRAKLFVSKLFIALYGETTLHRDQSHRAYQ
jgi:hypothetical protein